MVPQLGVGAPVSADSTYQRTPIARVSKIQQLAWVGVADDLRRLGDSINSLAHKRVEAAALDYKRQTGGDMPANDLSRLSEQWSPTFNFAYPNHTDSGVMSECLEHLDARQLLAVAADIGPTRYGTSEQFRVRLSVRDGVKITLKSNLHPWLSEARETLGDETALCRPWWAWFRGPTVAPMCLNFAVLVGVLEPLLIAYVNKASWWILVVASVFLALVGGVLWPMILKRIVPGLQVIHPGEVPKGRRCLGVIGAVSLAVAVAIVTSALK